MSNKISHPILKKVLFIGPDKKCLGGIASVLASYSNNFEPFNYLPTNSKKGKVAGYLRLLLSLSLLPVERIKGRKILHIHYGAGKSFMRKRIVMSVGRLLGYKVVGHSHSGHFKGQVSKNGRKKIRRQLGNVNSHVVLTRHWREFFADTLGLSASIVNNIINHAETYRPITVDADKPLVLYYLGRLTEKKGVSEMLDAIKKVLEGNHKIRLIMGGDGDQRSLIEQKILALGLENVVDYRGPLNSEECRQVINESDVMILPSYAEGLPISILEAFEFSRPVITTGVGGIPDLVTDGYNGKIISPGDINSICDAIIYFDSHREEIKRMGANGKQSLSPYYPESVLKALVQVYEPLLDKN